MNFQYRFASSTLLACVAAFCSPAQAQSNLWDAARNSLQSLQNGRTPKSEPIRAQGAVDSWGDPLPMRGDPQKPESAQPRIPPASSLDSARIRKVVADTATETNQTSTKGSRPLRAVKTAQPAGNLREQRIDERELSDREQDERGVDERFLSAKDRAGASGKSAAAAAPTRSSTRATTSGRTPIAERVFSQRTGAESEPNTRTRGCVAVSRAWEGAAAMAQAGEEERAYDAYLRLLGSCQDEKELIGTVFQAQKHLSPAALDDLLNEPALASPKLRPALFKLKLAKLFTANKTKGGAAQALSLSRELREELIENAEVAGIEVSAWLEQRAGNHKVAEQLFRTALKFNRDSEGAREGLVFALLGQKKLESASREAERLQSTNADEIRSEVLLAQARQLLEQEQPKDALKMLDRAVKLGLREDASVMETRAWALKGAGLSARAAKIFEELLEETPDDDKLVAGLIDSLKAARDYRALERIAAGDSAAANEAKAASAERLEGQGRRVEAARARGESPEGVGTTASAVVQTRSKSGDAGEGRLKETVFPAFSISVPLTEQTTMKVEAIRLKLDDSLNVAKGTEIRAQVATKVENLEVTVGAGVSNANGNSKPTFEAKVRAYTDTGHIEAGISREPVRDSVRSYAGVPNEVSVAGGGLQTILVGRAFDTNAYIGGASILDTMNRYKLEWMVGGGSVGGTNTPNNGYYRASAALTKEFVHDSFSWLAAGPFLSFQSYERDENRFEPYSGGYFSPKSDVGTGLQVKLMTKEGLSSIVKTDAKLGYVSRGLKQGNDSGVSLELAAEGAWLVSPHLVLGAGAVLRASPGYNDFGMRVGVQVPFERRTKLFGDDLKPFRVQ